MSYLQKFKWQILLIILLGILLFTPIKSHFKRIVSLSTSVPSEKLTKPNAEIWEVSLQNLSGKEITLKDFQGQLIFLHFWGTWCPDCRLEMPELHTFYQKNSQDIAFVFVAIEKGNPKEKLNRFKSENPQYTFESYFPKNPLPKSIKPTSFPTTYLISPKGKIIWKKTGATKWSSPEIQDKIADWKKL